MSCSNEERAPGRVLEGDTERPVRLSTEPTLRSAGPVRTGPDVFRIGETLRSLARLVSSRPALRPPTPALLAPTRSLCKHGPGRLLGDTTAAPPAATPPAAHVNGATRAWLPSTATPGSSTPLMGGCAAAAEGFGGFDRLPVADEDVGTTAAAANRWPHNRALLSACPFSLITGKS